MVVTPPLSATPPFEVVDCESWEAFKTDALNKLFEGQPFYRGRFLFRGHGSDEWPLKSSFDRWFTGRKARKRHVAARLIDLFKKEAEGLDVESGVWEDPIRSLALAQHSGVPTRLLDWTESPYVAGFFAFAGAVTGAADAHVGVWCLDRSRNNVWDSGSGVEILEVPSYSNVRLRNQLGWFTLLNAPYDSLEEYVMHFAGETSALRQFRIPVRDAPLALADVEMMGITYTRIYPGLDGCARTATLRARREEAAA